MISGDEAIAVADPFPTIRRLLAEQQPRLRRG